MVMKPEPWGEALDALAGESTVLVVPTPSGQVLTQSLAADLAAREHLLIACGRYEGIDQRVMDHAATRMRVVEVSLGDYVLNGGEVAALAIVEAVARLLPGFMGNEASLDEESHGTGGLLEQPVYTKPESWRGLDVPAVLLSGDHARIAAWRREESRRRTAERRPDLLHASQVGEIEVATGRPRRRGRDPHPATRLLGPGGARQRHARDPRPPRVVRRRGGLDGRRGRRSWRARPGVSWARPGAGSRATPGTSGGSWWRPTSRGRGLGRRLLEAIETAAPDGATSYHLFTGARSTRNQRLYKKAGYSLRGSSRASPARCS